MFQRSHYSHRSVTLSLRHQKQPSPFGLWLWHILSVFHSIVRSHCVLCIGCHLFFITHRVLDRLFVLHVWIRASAPIPFCLLADATQVAEFDTACAPRFLRQYIVMITDAANHIRDIVASSFLLNGDVTSWTLPQTILLDCCLEALVFEVVRAHLLSTLVGGCASPTCCTCLSAALGALYES